MKKFLKSFNIAEWIIWSISVAGATASFFAFKNDQYHYLIGAIIGVTALVFVSKGNPIGQILTVGIAVFYGVISFSFKYYGEMLTYLGMTAPIAIAAVVSWLKHPHKGNASEVTVNSLSKREWVLFIGLSVAVTVAFYFILKVLGTANLIVSTVSVFTSFAASYLTLRRSRFYAVCYAANDIVLIVMWALACKDSLTYLPMVVCFVAFLALDIYGFINWSAIKKRQKAEEQTAE